jgi:hypothetical protein
MFIIRNVFKCKPGQAKNVIEHLQNAMVLMPDTNQRILVDHVADFWTVVLEIEVESVAAFEEQFREYGRREDVQKAMTGYLDSVASGHREIYRIV